MMILHDAGVDQGGSGAADGLGNHQLTVLREAGFDVMILHDAGGDQDAWSAADGIPISWKY